MNLKISGYDILDEIYVGRRSRVYRAIQVHSDEKVILKIPAGERPSVTEIARFKKEYKIGALFKDAHIARYLALENSGHLPIIVKKDYDSISLSQYIKKYKPAPKNLLTIGMQLIQGLEQIHARNIIHKDINPDNIIIHPESENVRLIDFGMASYERHEEFANTDSSYEVSSYTSPEQTGRTNQPPDFRSDYYSLGAVFYEFFTGFPPFNTKAPLELIHYIIARYPPTPREKNPAVPHSLSRIVMKLLDKNPDERYSGAYGLKQDLVRCKFILNENPTGEKEFRPGENDITRKFQTLKKLYGRKREMKILSDCFEDSLDGNLNVLLITGQSGIGKSALVGWLREYTYACQAYFISGKFDQISRRSSGIITEAFRGLLQEVLMDSEEQLNIWKKKLGNTLNQNALLLTDIIPELALILSLKKETPGNFPDSQNRFNQALIDFIGLFATPNHPLVIFIDDLQWADPDSFNILKTLITSGNLKNCLLIGAYRDERLNTKLTEFIDSLKKENVKLSKISPSPLNENAIMELVAENLNIDEDTARPLARIVLEKTNGNPLFANQFLETLYQEKLITFYNSPGGETGYWKWDLEKIKTADITENMAELMSRKLKNLPEQTREILRVAAATGNHFTLELLVKIFHKPMGECVESLRPALDAGLIFLDIAQRTEPSVNEDPGKQIYYFFHDRFQKASYALIPEHLRAELHLHIGKRLLAETSAEHFDKNLLEITDHLNRGYKLIKSWQEKIRLADLNLLGATRSREANSYDAALKYLEIAGELLPDDSWENHYLTTFEIHKERLHCSYLNTNFESTLEVFEILSEKTRGDLEMVGVYNLIILLFINTGELDQAMKYGRKCAQILGQNLPEDPATMERVTGEKTKRAIREIETIGIDAIINLPELVNPDELALLELFYRLMPAAYQHDQILAELMIVTMAELSLTRGASHFAAYGYNMFAILLNNSSENYQFSYYLGRTAILLEESRKETELKGAVLFTFAGFICIWARPGEESLPVLLEGFQESLRAGDHIHAGYCAFQYVFVKIFTGEEIENVLEESEFYIQFLESKKDIISSQLILLSRAYLNALRQGPLSQKKPTLLDDKSFTEENFTKLFRKNSICLYLHIICRLKYLYIMEYYEEAFELPLEETLNKKLSGLISDSELFFYYFLLITAVYSEKTPEWREKYSKTLDKSLEKIQLWSLSSPKNFRHMYLMMKAEIAGARNENWNAADFYERALQEARKNKRLQGEALACELAAKFWKKKGNHKFASLYLRDALYAYRRWGADYKAKALEAKYNDLNIAPEEQAPRNEDFNSYGFPSQPDNSSLDILTVTRAAQAISREINLRNLTDAILKIIIENAGAEKGVLILKDKNEFHVMGSVAIDGSSSGILPLEAFEDLSQSILNYTLRTGETVIYPDIESNLNFENDNYILSTQPGSILCAPIVHKDSTVGALYLENNLAGDTFTRNRLGVLNILLSQAAISLENARLFENSKYEEKKVREKTAELETAIRELDNFSYSIAHDLRTPLRGIGGFSHALIEDYSEKIDEKGIRYLDRIKDAALQMSRLIDDLLLMSRVIRQDMRREKVNLSRSAREICRHLRKKYGISNVEIEIEDNLIAPGDPDLLRIMLEHLLDNSWKFLSKERPGKITFGSQNGKSAHSFYIQDNGVGFDMSYEDKLFRAFEKLHQPGEFEGAGIGLAVVERIISRHDGKVQARSVPNQGTSIIFSLPD